ncbi:MAG: aminopeptidase P N-terminal domain-containing protein [Chitinophagaceae bacterium]
MSKHILWGLFLLTYVTINAQEDVPLDYLSKEFHAGRRDALRKLMPSNSVALIFAYPRRTFSRDVNYPYHQNPDLYYFTGYKEPNGVLVIYKEPQQSADKKSYNELFFAQRKDSIMELWTGRRMGVDGVKSNLGIQMVFNCDQFNQFAFNFEAFDIILFDAPPEDLPNDPQDSADLFDLVNSFKKKASIPDNYKKDVNETLAYLCATINSKNTAWFIIYLKTLISSGAFFRDNLLISDLVTAKDSIAQVRAISKIKNARFNAPLYSALVASLREIKTPEELVILRKSIDISSIAHAETMKAIHAKMSETELQGLQEYVHKKHGAEYVGYPSIVGAGENGCVLHYIENNRTKVGDNLVLMDIGAEYHGYSADVTRTVPASGKFTPEQKAIYNLVYQAQEEVFKLCREDTPFSALNNKATQILAEGLLRLGVIKNKEDVERYYPHGCSHHLGLDVHDKSNYGRLKENMVITVEPGIYIPENSPCDKKWCGVLQSGLKTMS